ncbi:hypothetical protein ABOM_002716 [Aspergillus bombycis]|uniref:Uncharacterized protein n=1 Tax=Aspergillus bombycis TaxID=109264 RepID=A0A1F8A9H0_9EURO|nr:hypothetical protein ABOM_002716 [Aspergillus bombycis]OGM47938.1 hypothetical protein ABOM_002716 [Aspergillus bombycis]
MIAAVEALQRGCQERLRAIFSSWEQVSPWLKVSSHRGGDVTPIRSYPSNASHGFPSSHSNLASPLLASETASGSPAAGFLTPIDEYGHISPPLSATCPWLAHPDQIAACPSLPSPLDLLHGTRRSFLADNISHVLQVRAIRDPERLASGWLIYGFSKGRVSPGLTAVSQIPPFLRPVLLQMPCGHPAALDLLILPQIRINLTENWEKNDFREVFDYMSCCQKVRQRGYPGARRPRQSLYPIGDFLRVRVGGD